jgi:hypothetical protein
MALYDRPHDPQLGPTVPRYTTRAPLWIGNLIPILLAAAVVLIVIAMAYQRPTTERVGDTNAGPSVQTVTPAPTPSTSPAVPTPNPTTEPRPTQAPQP